MTFRSRLSASSLRSAPGGIVAAPEQPFLAAQALTSVRCARVDFIPPLNPLSRADCPAPAQSQFLYWLCAAYAMGIDEQVYFLRCRANSRRCLRRCLAFGYVARCCSRRNARLSCGADNGGRNTSPHTISPFTPFNSVPLRSGAFRFLKPDCVAWLLSNNRKRLLLTFPRFCNSQKKTA